MSDCDRRDSAEAGRLILSAFAVMAGIALIGFVWTSVGEVRTEREIAYQTAQKRCEGSSDSDCQDAATAMRGVVADERATDYAAGQLWISVIGMLGLGATVVYARGAFVQAQRSADAAHTTLEADQRPWLSLKFSVPGRLKKQELQVGGQAYFTDTDAIIKNHGRAPATNVSYHAEIAFLGPGSGPTEDMLRAFMAKVVRRGFDQGVAVFSEDEFPTNHMVAMRQVDIDAMIEGMEFKHITPCILGCVNYQSGHTKGVRQTGALALLSWGGDDGMARVIRPDTPNWWEMPVGLPGTFTMIAT